MSAKAPLDQPPSRPSQRARLRELLLQRRQVVLEAQTLHSGGATRVQHARDVLTDDRGDTPARSADREIDLVLTDHEHHELAEIGAALRRLDDDDFGQCSDCGAEIPYARLEVQPQAKRCVACEGRHEAPGHGLR